MPAALPLAPSRPRRRTKEFSLLEGQEWKGDGRDEEEEMGGKTDAVKERCGGGRTGVGRGYQPQAMGVEEGGVGGRAATSSSQSHVACRLPVTPGASDLPGRRQIVDMWDARKVSAALLQYEQVYNNNNDNKKTIEQSSSAPSSSTTGRREELPNWDISWEIPPDLTSILACLHCIISALHPPRQSKSVPRYIDLLLHRPLRIQGTNPHRRSSMPPQ